MLALRMPIQIREIKFPISNNPFLLELNGKISFAYCLVGSSK